jgi:hypothetical protein
MSLEIREVGSTADPVHCTVCGAVVLEPYDPDSLEPWDPAPACGHLWGLWHDHGIAYLSGEARAQLAASGVLVLDDPTLGIELEVSEDPDSQHDRDPMDILTGIIHGQGALVLAVYSGPPTLEGTYVGVAERLGQ